MAGMYRMGIGRSLTPMVKRLLIANVAVFIAQYIFGYTMVRLLGLNPDLVLQRFFVWQVGTYMFLHGGMWHLIINMYFLWMIGCEIESYWGEREFLKYYLLTGIGAGVINMIVSPSPVIGASGAVFGLLVAFGVMFPRRIVLAFFVFPLEARYFVIIMAAVALFAGVRTVRGDNVAHFAHLGGALVGFVYLMSRRKFPGFSFSKLFAGLKPRRRRQGPHLVDADRIDKILDKINRKGYAGLTPDERRILDDYSKDLDDHE